MDFIANSSAKYVLLCSGSFVYNIDFAPVLRFHQNTNADITLVSHVQIDDKQGRNVVLDIAENGLVSDIAEKPLVTKGMKVSLGIYLMNKEIFVDSVRHAYERAGKDFLVDGILRRSDNYKLYAYAYDGYMAHVDSMDTYYRVSMEMLEADIWSELFMGKAPIYTKIKDGVPVQYKESSKVVNSLIANGCVIEGEVENSILFRGVKIGKNAKIKNSIVMQHCEIQEGVLLEYAICDKNVVITPNKKLIGAIEYPMVIKKNLTI